MWIEAARRGKEYAVHEMCIRNFFTTWTRGKSRVETSQVPDPEAETPCFNIVSVVVNFKKLTKSQ
jgi:hypothetical protein